MLVGKVLVTSGVTGLLFPTYELGGLSVLIHLLILPGLVLTLLYKEGSPMGRHSIRVAVAVLSMTSFFL